MYKNLLLRPVMTEKMAVLQERENKYAFIVDKKTNKIQIKNAVQEKFDVIVKKVSTMNFEGKIKQMTTKSNGRTIRTQGRRASFKKAVVTLEIGHSIDYVSSSSEGVN